VSARPEETIRRHLSEHGGQTEATVDHLLGTFDVSPDDTAGRALIAESLAQVGVTLSRPLAGLDKDEMVLLAASDRDGAVSKTAPWSRRDGLGDTPLPATDGAGPAQQLAARRPRSTRRTAVVALVIVVLAAGAAVGGYLLGRGTGEDLDAARAVGARQGERIGTARGTARGYDRGFKEGRRAGYRQTYDTAYDRAYNAQLKKAGFDPVKNPSSK
jgi:hypothetical protein